MNLYWIYGIHQTVACLENVARVKKRLVLTQHATKFLNENSIKFKHIPHTILENLYEFRDVTNVQSGVVHQGFALQSSRLKQPILEEFLIKEADRKKTFSVVILDKVTDPYNIGSIIRSCAAFGIKAVITTRFDAPDETSVILKAACGGFEKLHYIKVTIQAIKTLKMFGFTVIGLSSDGKHDLREVNLVLQEKFFSRMDQISH